MESMFRSFSRRMLWVAVAMGIVGAAARAQPTSQPAKSRVAQPNVILILADDMGFSDLGCYGSEIHTPNIDALAHQGVRFAQFYNMARCCPTRASILTGLYPHQAGIGCMNQDLHRPGYEGQLNDKCVTIAEVLHDAGYRTAAIGKWHLANLTISSPGVEAKPLLNFEKEMPLSPTTTSWPNARGFDEHVGTIPGVENYFDPYGLVENGKTIKPVMPDGSPFYYTDFLTQQTTKLIDQFSAEKKPFFMYVAYTAPHWPMQAHEEDIQHYADTYSVGWDKVREARLAKQKEMKLLPNDEPLSPSPPNRKRFSEGASVVGPWAEAPAKEWQARRMAVYAAMIECLDRGVGKIVEKVHADQLDENTVIIFLSDNGGCAENVNKGWYDIPSKTRDGQPIAVGNDPSAMPGPQTVYQSYGAAWANVSNTPFRRFKHFTEEGGISAPFIVKWPGHVSGERIERTQVGDVIDLMPTILQIAGATYPATRDGHDIRPAEGVSLLPAIENGAAVDRSQPLFWEHEGNRAVRVGQWKLIAADGENWQLYDVVADRTESHDLASEQPARVAEMRTLYDAWAKRCGVQPWPIHE